MRWGKWLKPHSKKYKVYKMQKKLHLISLGCTKNLVDSEVMLGKLSDYENTQEINEADVIIVNTCGFIEAAKKESIQTLLEALETKKQGAILVASGCLSERYAKELKEEIEQKELFEFNNIEDLHNLSISLSGSNESRISQIACEISDRLELVDRFKNELKNVDHKLQDIH